MTRDTDNGGSVMEFVDSIHYRAWPINFRVLCSSEFWRSYCVLHKRRDQGLDEKNVPNYQPTGRFPCSAYFFG